MLNPADCSPPPRRHPLPRVLLSSPCRARPHSKPCGHRNNCCHHVASACLAVGSCEPTPRTSPVSSPQSERPQPCGALILKLPGSSTFEGPPLPTGSWVYAEVAPLCHLSLKGSACYNEPNRGEMAWGLSTEQREVVPAGRTLWPRLHPHSALC